jgi:hypothetical protein
MRYAPLEDTPQLPEWVGWTAGILAMIAVLGSIAWMLILTFRYTAPYTLQAASNKQKWKWSAHIAFSSFVCLPFLGILPLLLGLQVELARWLPLLCIVFWLILLPLTTIYEYASMNTQLRLFRRESQAIRAGTCDDLFPVVSTRMRKWLLSRMGEEYKRFYAEGYPDGEPAAGN